MVGERWFTNFTIGLEVFRTYFALESVPSQKGLEKGVGQPTKITLPQIAVGHSDREAVTDVSRRSQTSGKAQIHPTPKGSHFF